MTFPADIEEIPLAATMDESVGSTLRQKMVALIDATLAPVVEKLQLITVGPTFTNLKGQGGVGIGTGNDSAAIASTFAAGPTGSVCTAPAGEYMVDPGVMALLSKRNIVGDGADTTWFTLRSDTAGAALSIEVTGAGVRGAYGTRVKGIGINLGSAPSATGIRVGVAGGDGLTGNWTHLDDVRVEGGVVSFDCEAINVKLTNFHFINATQSFIIVHPTGQEFRASDGIMEIGPGWTTAIPIDIPILVGGPAGAVYLRDIALNNGGTAPRGIYEHCPNGSTASVPLRCYGIILDNLSGPGYDLVNVTDAQIMGGWVNAAAGVGNGAVRFYGGGAHVLVGIEQLNGGSGSACTFDFAGGTPTGITLQGNVPATGPIYRLSATGKPVDLLIADHITAAAVIANVTNDPEGLRLACATGLWTPPIHSQREFIRESGTNPPAGVAIIGSGGVPGLVTVPHTGVGLNTRVKLSMERPLGTGVADYSVYSSIANNVVGTSFRISAVDVNNESLIYWEMYDPT